MKFLNKYLERQGFVTAEDVQKRVSAVKTTAYRSGFMAAQSSRLTWSWSTDLLTMDQMLKMGLSKLKERSRDIVLNNDYGRRFINLIKTHVVGPFGPAFQSKVKDPSGRYDNVANNLIESAWKKWCKKANASVSRKQSFKDLCILYMISMATDGEALFRKIRNYNNPFRYALQPIDTHLLDVDLNKDLGGGRYIRMGIEFDPWDAPVNYYIKKTDTDSYYSVHHYEIIPARDIIHVFNHERAFQSRGFPWLCAALLDMQSIKAMEETEMIATRVSAAKMGFIIPPEGGDYEGDKDDDGNYIDEVEPGVIDLLPPGFDFKTFDPGHPNGSFAEFKREALHSMASGANISYHTMASDLKGVNYTSSRTGALEDRDYYKTLQQDLIENFCTPVFEDVLEMALLTQQIPLPFSKYEKFNHPQFRGRRWDWVDPAKDMAAAIDAIEYKLKSRTQIMAENGFDIQDVFQEIAQEEKMAAELGISLGKVDSAIKKLPPEEDDGETDTE